MTLPTGTRLGPYEVLGPLGAGGMGEVYRARDTRLGREVAIKVLPAVLASNPERLKRFEREARSASSLNHPNIVTIHDIGSADSVSYIAMELVEGRTLRDLLVPGPLPTMRLLTIATQVAQGLARAHEAGIVHRDLKPENVMVTEDGLVKILDFGLAKLTQPDSSGSGRTQAPTVSGATEEGVILGTVGYMSPEQAMGGTIDYRSDQFSFGSILYEMATGRRAFVRGSVPETLTAIIREEPEPVATVNPKVPAPVRWIIERCLAKEPRSRYTSTDDLARDLATLRDRLSEASAIGVLAAEQVPARRWWRIMAAIMAAILLAVGISGWLLRQRDYFWKNPLAGASFTRLTDWGGSEIRGAISADGKFVAFASDRDGPYDVWTTQVRSGEFLKLTKGAYRDQTPVNIGPVRNLAFTPDGAHLGISRFANGKDSVVLVPTIGGVARAFLPGAVEAAWSPDGNEVAYYTVDPGDPIFKTDRNGGNRRQIFIAKPGVHNHYLAWSPSGRFLYFLQGSPVTKEWDLWRIPSAGGAGERLTHHGAELVDPVLLDEHTVVYSAPRGDGSGSGLYAMDVERRVPHLVTTGIEEYRSLSSSADGRRLVAAIGNRSETLWKFSITDHLVDDAGIARFNVPAIRAAAPRFGKDSVLYLSSKGGRNGLLKLQGGTESQLWQGGDGSVTAAAAVSRDGSQIAFVARLEARGQLCVVTSDGTNVRRLARSLDVHDSPSWSPDGNWLAVAAKDGKGDSLYKVPSNDGEPMRLAEGGAFSPVWSPDGRLIVYGEHLGGAFLKIRGVTPEGHPWPIPDVSVLYGGDRYRFLPDGKQLVVMLGKSFWSEDFWLFDLSSGHLRQLTNLQLRASVRSFDVSPDAKEVLFDRYDEKSDIVLIDLPPR